MSAVLHPRWGVFERKVHYLPCIDILACTVNGKTAPEVEYEDPYSRFGMHTSSTVHQHELLRKKLDGVLHDPPEFELIIPLPPSVRIEPAVSHPLAPPMPGIVTLIIQCV